MPIAQLFTANRPIIGMVHLLPLPGAPRYRGSLDAVFDQAQADAATLIQAGVDALIVENFGDEPYRIGPAMRHELAIMTAITRDIVRTTAIPVGVNIQFNAWEDEIAAAFAAGAQFARVEVFVDRVVSAQGVVEPCSALITRYRAALGAQVQIWADIQTKYTTNITPQPLTQSAVDAEAAGADVLIVTGAATGQATPLDAVAEVKAVTHLPVVVGSGTTAANVAAVLRVADGAIVGSAFKVDGKAANPVDADRAAAFMRAARG